MVTRLAPKTLLALLLLLLALLLWLQLSVTFNWWPHEPGLASRFRNTASIVGFALAFLLNLEIAREYRQTRLLRWAWLALAANAGISVIRMILEGHWLKLIWPDYTTPVRGLWQHLAIVPANVCLLVGVAALCLAYHRVGVGLEIRRRDYALIAIIAAVLIALLTYREGLTEANSPYPAGRYLQQLGLILLALISAMSVLLHGMALRMGGGLLARVLLLITLYAMGRSTLVLLSAIAPLLHPDARLFIKLVIELGWLTVVWLPALAAAYRIQMTMDARRETKQFERQRLTGQAAPLSA